MGFRAEGLGFRVESVVQGLGLIRLDCRLIKKLGKTLYVGKAGAKGTKVDHEALLARDAG